MFCFLKACWKMIWSPQVAFVFVLNAFLVHMYKHKGGKCILGDCAICSEKFLIVVQRNRAFGTMCLVNWDTNAGGIVVVFFLNISMHIFFESCGKPLVVSWGGLAPIIPAIAKHDHLLAFCPQSKSLHCRRTCLFFLWWYCFYETSFTITVCPGIRLNMKTWAGRHNSS